MTNSNFNNSNENYYGFNENFDKYSLTEFEIENVEIDCDGNNLTNDGFLLCFNEDCNIYEIIKGKGKTEEEFKIFILLNVWSDN